VDGFELNLSCPHAQGYGMQLGQDREVVLMKKEKELVLKVLL
jgi:dihydroorotate dehydrogenase